MYHNEMGTLERSIPPNLLAMTQKMLKQYKMSYYDNKTGLLFIKSPFRIVLEEALIREAGG